MAENCVNDIAKTMRLLRKNSLTAQNIENVTDLRYIKKIQVTAGAEQPEIYTPISNKSLQKIISPFDRL